MNTSSNNILLVSMLSLWSNSRNWKKFPLSLQKCLKSNLNLMKANSILIEISLLKIRKRLNHLCLDKYPFNHLRRPDQSKGKLLKGNLLNKIDPKVEVQAR